MKRRTREKNDATLGCLAYILVGIFALPFVGIYLMGKENSNYKAMGFILFIVGLLIWFCLSIG